MTEMTLKLGIIGAGKMAGALVKGWVQNGIIPASQVGYKRILLSLEIKKIYFFRFLPVFLRRMQCC